VQGGFAKVFDQVGVGGSIAALACAAIAPLVSRLREEMCAQALDSSGVQVSRRTKSVFGLTAALWLFGLAQFIAYSGIRG